MLEHRLRGDAGTLFAGGLRFRGACRTHASRILRPPVWRAFAGNTGAGSIAECDVAHCHALIFRAFAPLLDHSGSLINQREQATCRSKRLRQICRQRTQRKRRAKRAGEQHESRNQRRSVRIHGTHPHQAFRHIGGSGNHGAQRHHKESRNRREQHHQYRAKSCKIAIFHAQTHTFAPQRARATLNGRKPGIALAEADDFADATHVVKHFVIKGGRLLAQFRTDAAHRGCKEFRQYDADNEVRDDERRREGRTEGE